MDALTIMAGSLAVNVVAVILTVAAMRRADASKLVDRVQKCEAELATVDNRIMVACHARVKRSGEYWEFVNDMRDFKDDVYRTGLLK